jgi:DNA-binding transcriptional regulator YiaG
MTVDFSWAIVRGGKPQKQADDSVSDSEDDQLRLLICEIRKHGVAELRKANQSQPWLPMDSRKRSVNVRANAQSIQPPLSNQKFSFRKAFPTEPKTIEDNLILKRYVADLSQAEVAALVGVSNKKLRSWENDKSIPTNAEWNLLTAILSLNPELINSKPNTRV